MTTVVFRTHYWGGRAIVLVGMHIGVFTLGNLVATAIVRRVGARRLVYLGFVLLSIGMGGQRSLPRCH